MKNIRLIGLPVMDTNVGRDDKAREVLKSVVLFQAMKSIVAITSDVEIYSPTEMIRKVRFKAREAVQMVGLVDTRLDEEFLSVIAGYLDDRERRKGPDPPLTPGRGQCDDQEAAVNASGAGQPADGGERDFENVLREAEAAQSTVKQDPKGERN